MCTLHEYRYILCISIYDTQAMIFIYSYRLIQSSQTHTHKRNLIYSNSVQFSQPQCKKKNIKSRTVYVEACRMWHFASTILCNTGILAAVLHHHMGNIDMTNNVSMHRNVLANHKSTWIAGETNRELYTSLKMYVTCAYVVQEYMWKVLRRHCIYRYTQIVHTNTL